MEQHQSYDKLIEKWAPVLNEESAGTIKDHHRRSVTAAILENQEISLVSGIFILCSFFTSFLLNLGTTSTHVLMSLI